MKMRSKCISTRSRLEPYYDPNLTRPRGLETCTAVSCPLSQYCSWTSPGVEYSNQLSLPPPSASGLGTIVARRDWRIVFRSTNVNNHNHNHKLSSARHNSNPEYSTLQGGVCQANLALPQTWQWENQGPPVRIQPPHCERYTPTQPRRQQECEYPQHGLTEVQTRAVGMAEQPPSAQHYESRTMRYRV